MKYKSEILEVLHQDAIADFEVGAISESRMREFDEMCLVQEGEKTNKYRRGSLARISGISHPGKSGSSGTALIWRLTAEER